MSELIFTLDLSINHFAILKYHNTYDFRFLLYKKIIKKDIMSSLSIDYKDKDILRIKDYIRDTKKQHTKNGFFYISSYMFFKIFPELIKNLFEPNLDVKTINFIFEDYSYNAMGNTNNLFQTGYFVERIKEMVHTYVESLNQDIEINYYNMPILTWKNLIFDTKEKRKESKKSNAIFIKMFHDYIKENIPEFSYFISMNKYKNLSIIEKLDILSCIGIYNAFKNGKQLKKVMKIR